jgi:hypothetical protein
VGAAPNAQQPFAANFLDRRTRTVDHQHCEIPRP